MTKERKPEEQKAQQEDRWEVKGVKSFMGLDFAGYNASLYRNGKKVAFVIDEGCGGEPNFDWTSPEDQEAFADYARSVEDLSEFTGSDGYGATLPDPERYYRQMAVEFRISAMVEDYEEEQRLRRKCKTKTYFRVKGDPEDVYRCYKHKYDDRMKLHLLAKHPDIIEVLNERYQ